MAVLAEIGSAKRGGAGRERVGEDRDTKKEYQKLILFLFDVGKDGFEPPKA